MATTGIIEKQDFTFNGGEKLSAEKLRYMKSALDRVIDVVNSKLIKGIYNINLEENSRNMYTLGEAIRKVPLGCRAKGLVIKFMEDNGDGYPSWIEYTFLGDNIENDNWYNEKNWQSDTFDIIDGGLWQL